MLRQEILPDGTQRIGDRGLPVTVYDLRDLDAEASRTSACERIRDDKSHQLLDDEVLQISLSLLAGGRTRLHVDMDMQAADAVSYRNFMADLAALYRGAELPELGYTYREYRARLTASTPAPSQEDVQWWAERVPDLPEPPALPLVPRDEQANPLRNIRLWHIFDVADPRRAVRRRAPARHHPGDGGRRLLLQCAGPLVDEFALPAQPADVRPRALPPGCRQAGGLTSPPR